MPARRRSRPSRPSRRSSRSSRPGGRRHGSTFPRSDPRPAPWTKKTITVTLAGVNPSAGTITLRDHGGFALDHTLPFKNIDYQKAGSSGRAYEALQNLRKYVGRVVDVDVTYHNAFGWTVFGRKAVHVRLSH